MNKEPIITVSAVTAAISAVIALAVSFGLNLTQDQQNAIMGVVAVVAPLVVIFARHAVWSNASMVDVVSELTDATGPQDDGKSEPAADKADEK